MGIIPAVITDTSQVSNADLAFGLEKQIENHGYFYSRRTFLLRKQYVFQSLIRGKAYSLSGYVSSTYQVLDRAVAVRRTVV